MCEKKLTKLSVKTSSVDVNMYLMLFLNQKLRRYDDDRIQEIHFVVGGVYGICKTEKKNEAN